MTDWSAGYRADIEYTFGYFSELNPLQFKLALLDVGFDCPEIKTACELGFGQGLSTNIHGAGSKIEWYGNDFMPEQAVFARYLADASEANIHLFDDSFEEFQNRNDLPKFDFIGLHGIWSWVSEENRNTIIEFIRDRLNIGGIVYVSYNTHPGWSTFAPMRHLMFQYYNTMSTAGLGVTNQIDNTLSFAEEFIKCNPAYSKINPSVPARLKKMPSQDRRYIAHEYFNDEWHLMHFSELAKHAERAKLEYGCSSSMLDHVDAINFTEEQQALIEKIPDYTLQQSIRDFIVNRTFRRDLWVKGTRKLNPLERFEKISEQRIVLSIHRPMASLEINTGIRDIKLKADVYDTILDLIANNEITTIGNLLKKANSQGISAKALHESILVLVGAGYVSPANSEEDIELALPRTKKLNQTLLLRARTQGEISHLASPVTGGGVKVTRFQQLFLLASSLGHKSAESWAKFTWEILASQGQKIIKDNKALEAPEENIKELSEQAIEFENKWLPVLKALKVA